MVGIAKPPRTPWEFFPDVFIHASESAVKQHPAYTAAKAGDDDAAIALVLDAFSKERALEMKRFEGDAKPTLVSAHALEREGVNAIPEVFADRLGQVLDWPVDKGVVQVNASWCIAKKQIVGNF